MATEWTSEQKSFTEYVIGGVETHWDYAAVNYYDAITLGITQWWGYNAARLLEKIKSETPDDFAQLSQRLQDAVNAHPSSDSSFWPNFYLENADGESFKRIAQSENNHRVQDGLFFSDAFGTDGWPSGNLGTLASWGMNVDLVKQSIFMLCAYHQRPASALSVLNSIGGSRTLEDYRAAVLNDSVLWQYQNRYNEAYGYLAEWDGESSPPDFGQAGDPEDNPNNPDTDHKLQEQIKYIQATGQDLIVYGKLDSGDKLLCRNTGRAIWLPSFSSSPSYPSTDPDPNPNPGGNAEEFEKIKALWIQYENAFAYGYEGRLDPLASGRTDCSACIWWAANYVTDNKYSWLGTSTYTMLETCPIIYESPDAGTLDTSIMKPGDLILMGKSPDKSDRNAQQHVAMYWDDGSAWGAGYAPCPKQEVADASTGFKTWSGGWAFVCVARFLDE